MAGIVAWADARFAIAQYHWKALYSVLSYRQFFWLHLQRRKIVADQVSGGMCSIGDRYHSSEANKRGVFAGVGSAGSSIEF